MNKNILNKKIPKPNFNYKEIFYDGKYFISKSEINKYCYDNKEKLTKSYNDKTNYLTFLTILTFLLTFLTISNLYINFLFIFLILLLSSIFIYYLFFYLEKIKKIKKYSKNYEDFFEKKQIKLGKIKFKNNWITKKELKRINIEKINSQIFKLRKNLEYYSIYNNFQGEIMNCQICDYNWRIKKDTGRPVKCPSCNSTNIEFNKVIKINNKIKNLNLKNIK